MIKEDVLPEGWGNPKLLDLCDIKTGKVDANHHSNDGIYPFFTCALEPLKSKTYSFDDELIILPGNGANVGTVFYYNGKIEAYQRTYVLHKIQANPKFIYFHLLYLWKERTAKKQFGSATNYIRMSNFEEYSLPLPPLPEQQYLSQKLTALLDEVVQTKQRLEAIPALLKQFRQSVLADAVSGRLINNKFIKNNLLKDSVDILNGARKPISSTERKKIQGNIPYYGATGIVDYLNDFTHDGRFLLVGEDGANLLTKAKDLAYIVEGKVWVNNHAHVLKEKPSYWLNFIKIVINSLDLSAWVTGTAQPKLTKKALESLPIPHASLEQQTQIVQKVETYFALADEIETQVKAALENVNLLTQSILAKAFSGELSAVWRNSKVTETQGNV